MFESYQYKRFMTTRMRNIFRRVLLILIASVKVTVLFFIISTPGTLRADESSRTDLRLFEFTSEFYMLMGPGRLYGLMASDGPRHRIAIYWIEPAVYHDNTFFLGYSDFIFSGDVVHFWIYGATQPGIFDLSNKESDHLLPRDVSVKSVTHSALAIASRVRSESEETKTPMEVGKFFRQSRNQANYSYEVPSEQTSIEWTSSNDTSDVQILNALPYGRKYSKETQSDGTVVWQAQRLLEGPQVARVTVKPVSGTQIDDSGNMFNPNSLGQWTLVPEPYRFYWSFDRSYSELKDTMNDVVPSRVLHDRIESFLDNNKVPARIDMAFNQLLFKTALLTGDKQRVSLSAQAVVAALCRDSSTSSYQNLLELARIDVQIREQYPQQADDLVCPLIGLMVRHIGTEARSSIERIIPTIEINKWFSYGKLLIDEARIQGLVEIDIVDTFAARLDTVRLAKERLPVDPCETCASVKQYLAQLDADPPKGNLTMDDVRQILKEGLAKPLADANLEFKQELVEDVVRSIRLIAGEGPFRGDKARLIESVKRFSGLYLVVFRNKDPIDTVLATFLALSFCDISTPEDHDLLFSQIQKLCGEFQSRTNSMLTERGLGELVAPDDVEQLFTRYKQKFYRYIDDPLWPAFKFPLTANEQTRLRHKLKLRFDQLGPLLDEMALKVKYGGVSDELKKRTCYEIAGAILQLLPQAAFLRKPSYPGVSCQHQGEYGFTAVIRGPLYIEGDRPKEKFKAMKYFHLGHRLEEIVKRERELVRGH
ncbi:MAG: hypothetical protein D4R45_00590 [Planctomycetaceae bacterium]|nr:MAG: hypothetical protein D4R45_00590 [Planctomycetaceae bacterium]